MLKLSVITACFNNERTIEQTIQSVLRQNYNNIEYIVIDGASSDESLVVIKKYADQISILVSEPDEGIYDALNKGIARATGDVIGFVHADDTLYDKTTIEKIVLAFEQNNVEAVYGNLQYVQKQYTEKVIRTWISKPFHTGLLKKGWMPPHPTLYLRNKVYEKFGTFDLNFQIAADYDFMLRILSQNIKTHYLPHYIVKMRVGGKSNKLGNLLNKMKEDLIALRKNNIGGIYSLFLKNISKLPQFIKK